MDINNFILKDKAMVIAPAGFGKTHFIAECLRHVKGRQLILTHTNAGVAAMHEKIKKQEISSSIYNVETISGYAQKYIHSFFKTSDIPTQDDVNYYPFLIKKIKEILILPCISDIINSSYTGIFVDEYQDCTKSQHEIILLLSQHIPTRLIGDPMQGIFSFDKKDPLVDMNSKEDMGDFLNNRYELSTPWRWNISNNAELGNQLLSIRKELELNKKVLFPNYPSIEIMKYPQYKTYTKDLPLFNKSIFNILNKERNVLFIHPQSANISGRLKFVQQFKNQVYLIESLDDKTFYSFAKSLDSINRTNSLSTMYFLCKEIFSKTKVEDWITQTQIKNRLGENKEKSLLLKSMHSNFEQDSSEYIKNILRFLNSELTAHRKDLYNSLIKAVEYSQVNSTTIYEGMCAIRNHIRRSGRKIQGKCIGTTLLTKGLECDCVVLLDATQFTDNKHLYVALTRGSKRVVVFL